MSKRTIQRDHEKNSGFSKIQNERLTVLLTGYEQLNEEIRYLGQRLHQSYYLLISTAVVLFGLRFKKFIELWLMLIIGGFIFVVTGYMMFRFRVKQRSAQIIRRQIEEKINKGETDEIERLLRVQKDVWANVTRWDELEDLSLTHSRTDWDEFKKIEPVLSSRFLSQCVIILGLVFLGVGLYLGFYQ